MDNLKQLFAECDTDNNECLGREEFSLLCTKIGLNKEAADETFNRLDIDKNGRITFDEFTAGFNQYRQANNQTGSPEAASLISKSSSSSSPNLNNHSNKRQESPPTSNNLTKNSTLSPGPGRNNKLCPSPAGIASRKQASPLGVMSLGSTGSSSNLVGGRSSSAGADFSDFNSQDGGCYSNYGTNNNGDSNSTSKDRDSVVIYSSDNIADYDQASGGSDQFGSLISSSGSLSQMKNMQDLLDCVQKLQSENQILSQIFFKDKREREEYINQLGEEFDLQVKEVEERANKRAREELENEKKRLREMMQAERETLQHHYQTIEKMSKLIKSSANGKFDDSESIDRVKSKLEDTYMENRQLKKSLLDTKTDVALIWKEMEKLKQQYEDKLSSAYKRNNETRNECDHIKQQLCLMKDSNRKLQDASDVITNYITDKVEPVIKGATSGEEDCSNNGQLTPGGSNNIRIGISSQSSSRRGSILSQYLNGSDTNATDTDGGGGGTGIDLNNNNTTNSKTTSPPSLGGASISFIPEESTGLDKVTLPRATLKSNSSQIKPLPRPRNSLESSNSDSVRQTSTDSNKAPSSSKNDDETKDKVSTTPAQRSPNNHSRNSVTSYSVSADQSSIESNRGKKVRHKHTTSLVELSKSKELNKVKSSNKHSGSVSSRRTNSGRHFFIGSRESQSEAQDSSRINGNADFRRTSILRLKSLSLDHSDFPNVEPSDGPSRATFDIILVGDSFVGKSSFAARFMEGTFVKGLVSNCSIDFKTKSYKIDGVNYTVNIWDTAGQERFRSITASYFRKADGIILMYDVTDRRSYLNVRNWMSTISDTASENVAVLLVGNKIDLRRRDNKDKCVPTKEGSRLAKEYGIVFLETSVKTGTNLVPSMGKLIRMIARVNVPIEEDKDRIKLNDKSKTFNCMPNKC